MSRNIPTAAITIVLFLSAACASFADIKHDPASFTTIRGNALDIDGKPVRFFCATDIVVPLPTFSADDNAETRKTEWNAAAQKGKALVTTLREAGFNMVRLSSIPTGESGVQGNHTVAELYEHFIGVCKENGIRIWAEVMHPAAIVPISISDVTCLDDPTSATAWTNAVASCENPRALMLAAPWDPRIEVILQRRLRKWARSFNPYTGLRRCDDPVFALWSFEQLWWDDINAFGTSTLPTFFGDLLTKRWNKWLYEKFSSDKELRLTLSDLDETESIAQDNIRLVFADTCSNCVQKLPRPSECPRVALQGKFLLNLYAVHMIRLASPFTMLGESTRKSPIIISPNARRDTLNVISTARFVRPFSTIHERNEPKVMYKDEVGSALFQFDTVAFAISNNISVIAMPWRDNPTGSIFASQLFRSGGKFNKSGVVDKPGLAIFHGEITTNVDTIAFPQASVLISNITFQAYQFVSKTNSTPDIATNSFSTNAIFTISIEAVDADAIASSPTVIVTVYATDKDTGERLDTAFTATFDGIHRDEFTLYDITGKAINTNKSAHSFDVPFENHVFKIRFTSNTDLIKKVIR